MEIVYTNSHPLHLVGIPYLNVNDDFFLANHTHVYMSTLFSNNFFKKRLRIGFSLFWSQMFYKNEESIIMNRSEILRILLTQRQH